MRAGVQETNRTIHAFPVERVQIRFNVQEEHAPVVLVRLRSVAWPAKVAASVGSISHTSCRACTLVIIGFA
jgi:4'-phosphopantetheinyl transferase EntD